MPVCPFCQADLPLPSLPCGACGKRILDHPSSSAGKSYSARPDARTSGKMAAVEMPVVLGGAIPDLDLGRHAPRPKEKVPSLAPPAKKGVVPSRPPGSVSGAHPKPVDAPGVGGAVFDEDDIFSQAGDGGGSIELETLHDGPRSGPFFATAPPGTGLVSTPPAAPLSRPSSRAPVSRSVEPSLAESEAASLADYGSSPTSFWQAPLYAYRVKTRQSELRRQLVERKADLERARQAEERARVAFAERARPIAERTDGLSRALEPILRTERLMLERDGALEAEVRAHRARVSSIDERVQRLDNELETARSEEREIEGKLADAEAVRQRAEAKLKRAEIEIRSASVAAEASGVRRAPGRASGASS